MAVQYILSIICHFFYMLVSNVRCLHVWNVPENIRFGYIICKNTMIFNSFWSSKTFVFMHKGQSLWPCSKWRSTVSEFEEPFGQIEKEIHFFVKFIFWPKCFTEFISGQIERNAILECSPLCGFNSCVRWLRAVGHAAFYPILSQWDFVTL